MTLIWLNCPASATNFITKANGKNFYTIDIESFAELSALLDKLRKTSVYQMCPGIKDFDEILEDVRMQPAAVKEEH